MDQLKTGKFIAELRKGQDMTQKELADRLNVSDKLVSKWETGRGFPDISLMGELCEILRISVNELISGERVSAEDYSRKAEENMMNLVKDNEMSKRNGVFSAIGTVFGCVTVLLVVFLIVVSASGTRMLYFYFDLPTIIYELGLVAAFLLFSGQIVNFGKGIVLAFAKKSTGKKEIRDAMTAMGSAMGALFLATVLMYLSGVIVIDFDATSFYDEAFYLEMVGASRAVTTVALFDGALFELILLGLWARLKVREGKEYEN